MGRILKKVDKDKFCDCVNLFCRKGINVKEIGMVLGVDQGTARTRLLKALEIMGAKGGTVNADDFPREWFYDN